MKKQIMSALLLLALLIGALPGTAAAGMERITVRFYDEASGSYGQPVVTDRVNLTLDGAPLAPEDVPALIQYPAGSQNGRTLVPVRLISEALDATVTWVPETRQVIILREGSTIVLTLGSATALVDGRKIQLPDGVPAGVVKWEGKESTMVPLRFVSEQLGADVEWLGETGMVAITTPVQQPDPVPTPTPTPTPTPEPTPVQPSVGDLGQVTGLSFDQTAQILTISADHAPNYRITDLGDRLVIDLLGAVYAPATGNELTIPVESTAIETIRCYQHEDSLGYGYPHTLRIVLDLAAGVSYAQNLSVTAGGNQVRIGVTQQPEQPDLPVVDPEKITIAIDPGHGGNQPGAVYPDACGNDVKEKDLTLPMSLMLADILEARGYHVVLTRTGDDSIGLSERAQIANAAQAELFVSIHCNALDRNDYEGIFTYYYPNSTRGETLAKQVQAGVVTATGGIGRGTPSANFQVLRETTMPAVLVETGFMSCPAELARLCDASYQQKLAIGIANGIDAYLNAQS